MAALWQAFNSNWGNLLTALEQHIFLSLVSVVVACVISIPIGVYITRNKTAATIILAIVSVIQTIPSLALLGFMIPIFGIGSLPALIALTLYALLPVVRNTYTGIMDVDQSLIEAGRGMGMTRSQILLKVELPLARNVIMAGIRTATVLTIGVATLATFIGAGGLGDLIMRGVDMIDTPLILVGAIPAALLAIIFDALLGWIDKSLTPRGLR
ncbi:ABC transporter permease [Alicyclobacillus ferrooxydans]|uniref:Glycine/betaine ABC transporter n=1 Tax=Alicyclobacillus ferrooxydans TaxID=471514 RepID=A0A0P9ETE1_9BACL|nr:ABC transporter permease [Alicyclobacillus ferrooxydans]KPV42065.1 glycine/betaine ABC transporter [Alicyclobacillus ferrooxydans]